MKSRVERKAALMAWLDLEDERSRKDVLWLLEQATSVAKTLSGKTMSQQPATRPRRGRPRTTEAQKKRERAVQAWLDNQPRLSAEQVKRMEDVYRPHPFLAVDEVNSALETVVKAKRKRKEERGEPAFVGNHELGAVVSHIQSEWAHGSQESLYHAWWTGKNLVLTAEAWKLHNGRVYGVNDFLLSHWRGKGSKRMLQRLQALSKLLDEFPELAELYGVSWTALVSRASVLRKVLRGKRGRG